MLVSQSSLRAPEAMHKRVYEANIDEELTKKYKVTEWDERLDIFPTVIELFNPTMQDCRHCGEPVQNHHHYSYEKYYDTMDTICVLRCDRVMIRNYFAHLKIFDQPTDHYRLFLASHKEPLYEINEGRKTQ